MQSHDGTGFQKTNKQIKTYHSGHRDEVGIHGDDAELDFKEKEKEKEQKHHQHHHQVNTCRTM